MSKRCDLSLLVPSIFLALVALLASCGNYPDPQRTGCTVYAYRKSRNSGTVDFRVFNVVSTTKKDGWFIVTDVQGKTTRFDTNVWDLVIEE